MPSVEVTIHGRKYRMACEEGQEEHLRALAENFDRRIAELKADVGEIGDARLTVVAALTLADELSDTGKRLREVEAELFAAKNLGAVAADRAHATQAAVAAALNAAAERIERVTRSLNQSLTESIPMG